MLKPKIGFVVYGVHKDGLKDPLGEKFINDRIVAAAKKALRNAGLDLVEHDLVIASKQEARACLNKFKHRDDIDALVLFSGTWVWAAHLIGALRDYAMTGKGIIIWTHPGSQGWRPVGGLVMQGACREIGLSHRFVYGSANEKAEIEKVVSYCRGSAMKNRLNLSTCGVFGGRGMGQTCGVADPSQWMQKFGIDIDSRDTTMLLDTAKAVSAKDVETARKNIQPFFSQPIPKTDVADRSLRLYMAIKQILAKENWGFYTIQSFPGLGDDYSATCFAQSLILNDHIGTSTLGDFNTCLTVKLLTDLSADPVYYGDLQHIEKSSNEVKIIGDGACPPALAGKLAPAKIAEHGIPTEGEAGGISVDLVCKPGEGVLARLGRNSGAFEMVIVRCRVFEPSKKDLQKRRLECGIPFWPHAFLTVRGDIDKLIQAWNNEYACLGYGRHLYEELLAFCKQTGIPAVTVD